MTEEQFSIDQFHRKMAVDLFNQVWTLIEKSDRTEEDNDRMVHAAHASRYHWGEIGKPLHFLRGEWQISRVYSILGHAAPAMYYAKRCLQLCEENSIGDFDLAFAYEAVARAHAVAGNNTEAAAYIEKALAVAEIIAKKEDKEYFLSDMSSIPGYPCK